MTQIRRIRFFTAPVVQQMIPHPAEEKKIQVKEKPRKVEKTHHTVDKKC